MKILCCYGGCCRALEKAGLSRSESRRVKPLKGVRVWEWGRGVEHKEQENEDGEGDDEGKGGETSDQKVGKTRVDLMTGCRLILTNCFLKFSLL